MSFNGAIVSEIPQEDSLWTHNDTGVMYKVIVVANKAASRLGWPITVVYRSAKGEIWSRPLAEWHDRLTKYVE